MRSRFEAEPRRCAECGLEFSPKRRAQRFCSKVCHGKGHHRAKDGLWCRLTWATETRKGGVILVTVRFGNGPLEHRIRVLPNDFVAWPEDLKRSINPKLRGKLSISIVQQATEFLALQSTKPEPEVEQQPPIDSPVPAVRWKRGGFHGFRCLTCGSETRIIPGDPHHVYCPTCDQTYRCREDNFTKISWEDGYV